MDIDIKKGENMFFIGEDEVNPIAFVSYAIDEDGDFIVDSTQVSDQLAGQGVGSKLVNIMVDFAEQEGKKIVPECPFARAVMERNDETRNMIKE